jgi:DNA-directed RNA polymerase sigma subunit (sigma70/sigma32)
VEYDDLKQVASYALLRGVDRFDPDLGMQFTTFITPTITGEIKNYFRDKSRLIKVPRRLGELNVAVKKYSAEYEAKEGRKPSVKRIAEALNATEEEVVRAMEIGGALSLDSMAASSDGDEDRSLYALVSDDEAGYESFENKIKFADLGNNISKTIKFKAYILYVIEKEDKYSIKICDGSCTYQKDIWLTIPKRYFEENINMGRGGIINVKNARVVSDSQIEITISSLVEMEI